MSSPNFVINPESYLNWSADMNEWAVNFLAGLSAGWSQIIIGAPFDFVKTKIQTAGKAHTATYWAKNIYRDYGMLGFYKGSSSIFLGFGCIIAIEFSVYEKCKKWISRVMYDNTTPLKAVFLSGAAVGLTTPLIYCPIEYAKLLVQTGKSSTSSSVKVLFDSVWRHGLGRVYRGYLGTILRETPSSGVYYCSYESFLRWKTSGRRDGAQPTDYLISGSVGGVSYWVVSYPMDVVKTKVQTGSTYKAALKECVS